jgi:adhesin transport system outer membrane protein
VAQAAEAKAVAAELDIRSAQLKLTERVSTVYSDLTANLTQARNLERVLRLNNDFFQSMLRQFQLGKRSWLDVLNALRDSNQSELGYATAVADAQLNSRRALLLSGQLEAVVDAGKGAAQ